MEAHKYTKMRTLLSFTHPNADYSKQENCKQRPSRTLARASKGAAVAWWQDLYQECPWKRQAKGGMAGGQEGTLGSLSEGTEQSVKVFMFVFQKRRDILRQPLSLQLKFTILS